MHAGNATNDSGATNVLGGAANQRRAGFLVGSANFPDASVVVLTALAKEPGRRYLSAEAFATALLRAAGVDAALPPPPKLPPPPADRAGRADARLALSRVGAPTATLPGCPRDARSPR